MKRIYTCERQKSSDVPYGRSPILKIRRTDDTGEKATFKITETIEKNFPSKKTPSGDLEALLWHFHEQLEKRDPRNFFAQPVTDDIAPGYSKLIRQPIDLGTIKQRLKKKRYNTIQEYQSDTRLMCHNAMTYNTPDTIYYQKARKLLAYIEKAMSPAKAQIISRELGVVLSKRQLGIDDFSEDDDIEEEDEDGIGEEQIDRDGSETTDGCTDYSPGPPRLSPVADSNSYVTIKEETVDDETAVAILSQVTDAAKKARKNLERKYGKDGIPKLAYLSISRPVTPEGVFAYECGPESSSNVRSVQLPSMEEVELFLGNGTVPPWQGEQIWRELEAINANPKEPVAAQLDWVLKGFTEETSRQLVSAYGDSLAVEYAYSLLTFASECGIFPRTLAHKCLNILTEGEHDKVQHLWNRRIPNAIPVQVTTQAPSTTRMPPSSSATTECSSSGTGNNVFVTIPSRQTATVQPFTRSERT